MGDGFLFMTVFPKILKVLLICSAYIKENKNKTAEAFLIIAQGLGAPPEIVIKGIPPFLSKLSKIPQLRAHFWLQVCSNIPVP